MKSVAASNEKEEEVCSKPLPQPPHRLDLGFWLCLREGLGCKQTPDFKILIFLLKSLEGRDKLTKIVQYGARYLAWYYQHYDKQGTQVAKYTTAFKAAQGARKTFHLFKTLEEADRFMVTLNDQLLLTWSFKVIMESASVIKCLEQKMAQWRKNAMLLRAASMMVYWLYDNTAFLAGLKLTDYDLKKASTRNGAAWSLASAIGMMIALIDLNELRKTRELHEFQLSLVRDRTEEQTPEKRSALEEKVQQERIQHFALLADFIRSACDFTVAANANGFDLPLRLTGKKLNDGVIGMAGILSSLFALWRTYPIKKIHQQ